MKVVRSDDPKQYEITEVLALVSSAHVPERWGTCKNAIVILDGEEIKVTNRLRTYLKGTDCVECGAKGTHFRKTRQSDQPRPHLNLYATNSNGDEVLMTSDHIVPRSKGGPNILENLQPMCATCNRNKADKMPKETHEGQNLPDRLWSLLQKL